MKGYKQLKGKELVEYFMKRFNMTKKQALAEVKKHKN
jgi:hypothetical protein